MSETYHLLGVEVRAFNPNTGSLAIWEELKACLIYVGSALPKKPELQWDLFQNKQKKKGRKKKYYYLLYY